MVPQMIAVDQIRPSRQQVRSRFDAEPLGELAESIRLHGVLQPILVRRLVDGYELIAGERRWRAARLAGLQQVPAVVRDDADIESSLGVPVALAGSLNRGRVELRYSSREELERVCAKLTS